MRSFCKKHHVPCPGTMYLAKIVPVQAVEAFSQKIEALGVRHVLGMAFTGCNGYDFAPYRYTYSMIYILL